MILIPTAITADRERKADLPVSHCEPTRHPSTSLPGTIPGERSDNMPEVEKQSSIVQEGESNIKPGGLSFEVVLEGPKTDEKPNIKCPPTPTLSAEDIEKKLKVFEYFNLQSQTIRIV